MNTFRNLFERLRQHWAPARVAAHVPVISAPEGAGLMVTAARLQQLVAPEHAAFYQPESMPAIQAYLPMADAPEERIRLHWPPGSRGAFALIHETPDRLVAEGHPSYRTVTSLFGQISHGRATLFAVDAQTSVPRPAEAGELQRLGARYHKAFLASHNLRNVGNDLT